MFILLFISQARIFLLILIVILLVLINYLIYINIPVNLFRYFNFLNYILLILSRFFKTWRLIFWVCKWLNYGVILIVESIILDILLVNRYLDRQIRVCIRRVYLVL
jgi:hypothetical protein